ncbi:MAG TPA: tetratricopeptide repeat protein [Chromatiales bacterium]|nr:tetratricopeptide repeat protein [Chromatiales bacterium]
MRLGLLVLLVLAMGSVAAHFLLQDNGYVLINFRGYSVEMSLPILLFLLVVAYLLVRLIIRIWRAPRELGAAAGRASARRAGQQTTKGLIALSEGKLSRGERLLTKAASNSPAPLLHYLTAARAAQMQGDHERRDDWLRIAYEQDPGAVNAVLLTQAELQMYHGEPEQALASLNRILEKHPQHPEALRLLATLRDHEQDWKALAELLPALRKQKNIPPEQLEKWTLDAWRGLLSEPDLDRAGIEQLWKALPRAMRKHPELIRARLQALVRCHALTEAAAEISKALKKNWDESLVRLYGEIEPRNPAEQLAKLESWLRERPEDPELLLAAGRACVRNQLWGKARSYFESSLAVRPSAEAYGALGQLMLRIGEDAAATDAFCRGLALGQGVEGSVPRLQADPVSNQEQP